MSAIIQFDSLNSTNLFVKEHAAQFDPNEVTCVSAREQTAGYGRRGKSWVSPRGNLYATFFFCLSLKEQRKVATFTQLMALACVEMIEEQGISLSIKWPNDLVYEMKKCGGILTESFPLQRKWNDKEEQLGVALGLGLNVNTKLPLLDQPTIALCEIKGSLLDLDSLLRAIKQRFEQHRLTGFEALKAKITAKLLFKGVGVIEGLTEDGWLLVRTERGIFEYRN